MSKAALLLVVVGSTGFLAVARPPAAQAYSSCNLTALGSSAIVGRCGTDRIFLTGGTTAMFGRIGAARTSITFTSASIFGYVGSNRFFYSVAGNSVFGRFGSLRFFASVLSSGTILGRVGSSRTNCLAAGSWYFCRGTPAEAVIPVAALLLSG